MPKCHCGKYALFNFDGQKPIFCTKHKNNKIWLMISKFLLNFKFKN